MVSDRSNGVYRSVIVAIVGLIKNRGRWILLTVFGASLASLILVWGWSKQAEYQRASEERTAKYQEYAYRPALSACIGITTVNKTHCIADARQAERENARDERDLEAQRVTALWTFIMGCAAITGMLLSAVGVGLVWTTFRETQRSASIANDSLQAMIDAERATIRFNEFGKIERAPNRPHMKSLVVTLNNIGRSNAEIRNIKWFAHSNAEWPAAFEMGYTCDLIVENQGNAEIDFIMYVPPNDGTHFVMGIITYATILGRTFETHFCYWVSPTKPDPNVAYQLEWQVRLRRWPGQPNDT